MKSCIFVAVYACMMLVNISGIDVQDTIWITGEAAETMRLQSSSSSTGAGDVAFTPDPQSHLCDCGSRTRLASRIVGGERSEIQKYPWMAGITAFGTLYCGGALIASGFVLTAAHCFKPFNVEQGPVSYIGVRLGVTGRNEAGGDYAVDKIIVHENYNKSVSGVNDIALIKLAQPVEPSARIRPICLPGPQDSYIGKYGTVAGWGVLTHGGDLSSTLQEVSVRILSLDECQKIFTQYKKNINSKSVCAGGQKGKDACQGDSGSPLFIEDEGIFKIIGVVSWGLKCALDRIPGVYTDVARYLPWIRSHVPNLCN